MSILDSLAAQTGEVRKMKATTSSLLRTVHSELSAPIESDFNAISQLTLFRKLRPFATVELYSTPVARVELIKGPALERSIATTDTADWIATAAQITLCKKWLPWALDKWLRARPEDGAELYQVYIKRTLSDIVTYKEISDAIAAATTIKFSYSIETYIRILHA